jgi:hypothetical protein
MSTSALSESPGMEGRLTGLDLGTVRVKCATSRRWFGNGRRAWFQCPGCQSRCRILYGGSLFRCRRCQGLKYETQYEPSFSRGTSRAHGLRRRLGQTGGIDEPFPPKPKGMHWKTYRRLEALDEDLQSRWAAGMMAWFRRCGADVE